MRSTILTLVLLLAGLPAWADEADFLKRVEALPAQDVTVLVMPPATSHKVGKDPKLLRQWGCAFTAPAGSAGSRKLADILRLKSTIPDVVSTGYRIGILADGFAVYLDRYDQGYGEQLYQFYPGTVAAVRKLAKGADFQLAPNSSEECRHFWKELSR